MDRRAVRAGGARLRSFERQGVSVRVRLEGLDRLACAQAVTTAMEADRTGQRWAIAPTAGGTVLALGDRKTALATVTELAGRLETAGYDGAVVGCADSWDELVAQVSDARPIPASAVLALTMYPPFQELPFNEYGAIPGQWGVPHEVTVAFAREWVEWVVPEDGLATVFPALIDVTREDALDVLVPHVEEARVDCQLFGSPAGSTMTRVMRARHFGEVMLTEAGSGKPRIAQALEMLTEHVLPHATQVDYATVRVARTLAHTWTAAGDDRGAAWNFIRHLWSQYVSDPNGIQVLTDAHLERARDLSTNWEVTPVVPGRWLVQAKDLMPWFETIDEDSAQYHGQYVDPHVLEQARYDFGDMVLTAEFAYASQLRRPRAR